MSAKSTYTFGGSSGENACAPAPASSNARTNAEENASHTIIRLRHTGGTRSGSENFDVLAEHTTWNVELPLAIGLDIDRLNFNSLYTAL